MRKVILFTILSLFFIKSYALAVPVAELILQSEPGDYIGQGQNFNITYDDTTHFAYAYGTPTFVTFSFSSIDFFAPDDYVFLDFSTNGLGTPLQPGIYTDAQRAAFADPGHPGLDVGFQHRGSNTLTGSFQIFDISFDDPISGLINTFEASFEQHSEGFAPALFGSFRYNRNGLTSDPATNIPEPASLFLIGSGLLGLFATKKRFQTA